ncbi:MAG TPA: anion transporter [Gemmatimonadales bacterium]|nr:anion transporter [Gemmatimonadales bacterium]
MAVPIAIFAATYLLIAVQRVPYVHLNRPAAALLGAVAMVAVGGLPLEQAYRAVDLDVMVFLLGLMILVGYLELGGFFEAAGAWLLRRAGTPARLLLLTMAGGGALSALFVNDTICLVLTPVLLAALKPLGVRPVPYLVGLAIGANIGSALTFVGNPQNMLIGVWSGLPFARFALALLPAVGGAMAIAYGVLRMVYRRELAGPLPAPVVPGAYPVDRRLVGTALALFALALVGWVAGGSLPLVAIGAGALMIALGRRDPAEAFAKVEWSLLVFFAALFVVMRGLEHAGAVAPITRAGTALATLGGRVGEAAAMSGAMLLLSNLVSNVPAVILWREVIPGLPDPAAGWLVLAMSSTFAGNLLLIGSMANLIVAERAEARGVRIGYWEYARAGVPVALLTIAWGVLVLALRP